MKTETAMFGFFQNKSGLLSALLLILFANFLVAQRIQNIALSSAGGIVRVDFSVIKGSNCNGYKIWHSNDSLLFQTVGDYPGLCSSPMEDLSHTFNHNSPRPNAVNYYKIELEFVETSDIQRIYVGAGERPLLTPYPNPVLLTEEYIQLKTSNTENAAMEGFICDEAGHTLRSLLLNCYNYTLQLPLSGLTSGIYFVWLSDGVYVYGTKFIVSP